MENTIKKKCYDLSLNGYSHLEIAKKMNISSGAVRRALNEIVTSKINAPMMSLSEKKAESKVFFKQKMAELESMKSESNKQKIKKQQDKIESLIRKLDK